MGNMEKFIDTVFGPIAMYMNKSPFFKSLTDAFIRMTPLTLGASVLMVIGFFPINAWQTWIKSVGIYDDFVAVQNATINALGLFLAFTFAFCQNKRNKIQSTCCWFIVVSQFYDDDSSKICFVYCYWCRRTTPC